MWLLYLLCNLLIFYSNPLSSVTAYLVSDAPVLVAQVKHQAVVFDVSHQPSSPCPVSLLTLRMTTCFPGHRPAEATCDFSLNFCMVSSQASGPSPKPNHSAALLHARLPRQKTGSSRCPVENPSVTLLCSYVLNKMLIPWPRVYLIKSSLTY